MIEMDIVYCSLQEILEGYNGFKIEIMFMAILFFFDYDLFFQYGNIMLEELGEG